MTPLDEWAYRNILAGTSIEWLVNLVFAKLVSDLLAGLRLANSYASSGAWRDLRSKIVGGRGRFVGCIGRV